MTILDLNPARLIETGASRARLWEPNPFLIEAVGRMAAAGQTAGTALDVACGSGRDAVYLALRGYEVEAIDVLPDALKRADDLARRSGVCLRTRVHDLERQPLLPNDRWQLLVVFRFLQRSLFPALRDAIRPGGYVVYETFHERTRQTGRRPQSPDHLLCTGELGRAFEGFEFLILREAYEREGRYLSCLLARKPTP